MITVPMSYIPHLPGTLHHCRSSPQWGHCHLMAGWPCPLCVRLSLQLLSGTSLCWCPMAASTGSACGLGHSPLRALRNRPTLLLYLVPPYRLQVTPGLTYLLLPDRASTQRLV